MPIGIGAGAAIAGIVGGGAAVAGGVMQSRAAGNAAKLQTSSANYAADIQAQAAREALAYQKEQAKLDEQRYETDRRANFDQWQAGQQNSYNASAARGRRLGTLGQMVGLGPREIPDLVMPGYVPSGTSGAPGAPGGPVGGGSAAARAAFDQLFPGETLTPQMLSDNKAKLEAAGFSLRPNAAGVVGKIQYGTDPIVDVIQGAGSGLNRKQWLVGGGGGSSSSARPAAAPRLAPGQTSLGFSTPATMTPALAMPTGARPRSLYDYLNA